MLFSKKRQPTFPPLSLNIDGCELAVVKQTKYLGVLLSSEMYWTPHVTSICVKARYLVGQLYCRFYKWTNKHTLLALYTAYVQPHLEYCACVWDLYLVNYVDLLESVQKFTLKVCCKR